MKKAFEGWETSRAFLISPFNCCGISINRTPNSLSE